MSRPPIDSAPGVHAVHQLVDVTVVAALDLGDDVAARRGAGDPDGGHVRLGTRVGEAHLVDVEAAAQLLGQFDAALDGDGEVHASVGRSGDGFGDDRVGVPDGDRAEPVVEVVVAGAVDVPHLGADALLEIDGVGVAELEARGDATGHRSDCPLVESLGGRGVGQERGHLLVGNGRGVGVEAIANRRRHMTDLVDQPPQTARCSPRRPARSAADIDRACPRRQAGVRGRGGTPPRANGSGPC
jgi:hypothetical protein